MSGKHTVIHDTQPTWKCASSISLGSGSFFRTNSIISIVSSEGMD